MMGIKGKYSQSQIGPIFGIVFRDHNKYVLSAHVIEIDSDDPVIMHRGKVIGCFRHFNLNIVHWYNISRGCRSCISNVDFFSLGNDSTSTVRKRTTTMLAPIHSRRER